MEIELAFTGICAFVQTKDGFAVVAPNARGQHCHIPWLHIIESQTAGQIDEHILAQWDLTTEEVWLSGTSPGSLKPGPGGNRGGRTTPNLPPDTIVPFAKACGYSTAVGASYTDPAASDSYEYLSLFCHLPAGLLEVSYVRQDIEWQFFSDNDPIPTITQPCAQRASVIVKIPDASSLTIASRDLRTQKRHERVIEIGSAPYPPYILFGNSPPDQEYPTPIDPPNIDEHFRIYYNMVTPDIAPDDQRYPHRAQGISPMIAHGLNCPPAIMF